MGRHVRRRLAYTLSLLFLALVATWWAGFDISAARQISASPVPNYLRHMALAHLSSRGIEIELPYTNLRESAALDGLMMRGPDFNHAQLSKLKGVSAVGGNFTSSNLQAGTFQDSDLTSASFERADLTSSSWNNVNLTRANFTSAAIKDTHVTNSNLTDAIFSNLSTEGRAADASNIDLQGSNWWMSHGWSETEQDLLLQTAAPDGFSKTKTYRNSLAMYKFLFRRSVDPHERISHIKDYAWFLTVDGADTDLGLAQACLNEAHKLLSDIPPDAESDLRLEVEETGAELLLRRAEYKKAADLYTTIVSHNHRDKGWQYRYLLATYLAADHPGPRPVVEGYQPTYEHVLFERAVRPDTTPDRALACDLAG